MTIAEAAQTVLQDAGRPLSLKDIYEEILSRKLYEFKAKSPQSVLSQTIRERSTANPKASNPIFRETTKGTYELNR